MPVVVYDSPSQQVGMVLKYNCASCALIQRVTIPLLFGVILNHATEDSMSVDAKYLARYCVRH